MIRGCTLVALNANDGQCAQEEGPYVGEAALSPLHESRLYWAEAKPHPSIGFISFGKRM